MKAVFETLNQCIKQQEDTVLVTVIESSGSTPRGNGARMVMSKSGHLAGTVGGGMVEKKSEDAALEILHTRESQVKEFILTPNEVADIGMICGGNVKILFQFLAWDNPEHGQIIQAIEKAILQHHECWLISSLSPENINRLGFYSVATGVLGFPQTLLSAEDFHMGNYQLNAGKGLLYIDSLVTTGKVYVFGGGHVAQALIPVLKRLDFYCVVYDDRPDFLTPELFPDADERIYGPLDSIFEKISITERDYGIVMTRGHKFDYELERQLLKTNAYYVGVMGSKRKIGTHVKLLQEEGFPLAKIKQVHMPIGLQISAETPAELAISIAGELIQERAKSAL